jgi:hypothetical protein
MKSGNMEPIRRKTTLEIIDETAAFYNLKNRSFSIALNNCAYNGDNGATCAFGRMCIDSTKLIEGKKAKHQLDVFGEEILKEEYRGHDKYFYDGIQKFHDNVENWNYEGLSEIGKLTIENLKKHWKNK